MWEKLGEPLVGVLGKALDACWLRQQVLAHNIANSDTPGYKRLEVRFEESLRRALENAGVLPLLRTHARHFGNEVCLSSFEPEVVRVNSTTWRNDGNNVDVEREMARQAENLLQYNLLARLVGDHLEMLRIALSEGRR